MAGGALSRRIQDSFGPWQRVTPGNASVLSRIRTEPRSARSSPLTATASCSHTMPATVRPASCLSPGSSQVLVGHRNVLLLASFRRGNTAVCVALVTGETVPVAPFGIQEGVCRGYDFFTMLGDFPESPVALPTAARSNQ